MTEVMVLQGREVTSADIDLIRALLAAHPARGRTPLSQELCRRWNWRNAQGRLKDMAARTLLLKLPACRAAAQAGSGRATSVCRREYGRRRTACAIAVRPSRRWRASRFSARCATCDR